MSSLILTMTGVAGQLISLGNKADLKLLEIVVVTNSPADNSPLQKVNPKLPRNLLRRSTANPKNPLCRLRLGQREVQLVAMRMESES